MASEAGFVTGRIRRLYAMVIFGSSTTDALVEMGGPTANSHMAGELWMTVYHRVLNAVCGTTKSLRGRVDFVCWSNFVR